MTLAVVTDSAACLPPELARNHGIDAANQIGKVFHAGTALNERGEVITNGGRVLCVVGLGDDVAAAKQRAYRALAEVRFDGMQYRTDIADKAMGR